MHSDMPDFVVASTMKNKYKSYVLLSVELHQYATTPPISCGC